MSGLREALAYAVYPYMPCTCDRATRRIDIDCRRPAAEALADVLFGTLADPEHRDEVRALIGDEQVEGIELCVEHDEPAIEGYDPMGFCRSGETDCRSVPLYAPREES